MSKYLDRAKELRAITDIHYNCAQSVILSFEDILPVDRDNAFRMGANFGAGMKMASICGAITGGLMVLGLMGVEDPSVIKEFYRKFRAHHDGYLDCANLLRMNKENGGERKPHCDAMVYEGVETVEQILKEQGIISE